MASTPESQPRPLFEDAAAARARPPAADTQPHTEPAGASRTIDPAPQHRVRPLDLPAAPPRPPVVARIHPLSLPASASEPPATPPPVQPLVLPVAPAPPTDRYAPASLLFDEGSGVGHRTTPAQCGGSVSDDCRAPARSAGRGDSRTAADRGHESRRLGQYAATAHRVPERRTAATDGRRGELAGRRA
jgi:hypothetical protein